MFHFHWNYIFELFCVFFFLIRKKRTSGIFLDYSFSSSHCDQELRKVLPCNEFFLTAFASCKKAIWAPKWINGSLLINKEKKKNQIKDVNTEDACGQKQLTCGLLEIVKIDYLNWSFLLILCLRTKYFILLESQRR